MQRMCQFVSTISDKALWKAQLVDPGEDQWGLKWQHSTSGKKICKVSTMSKAEVSSKVAEKSSTKLPSEEGSWWSGGHGNQGLEFFSWDLKCVCNILYKLFSHCALYFQKAQHTPGGPTEPELPVPSCRELLRLPLSWRPRLEEETPRVDASQLSAPHVFQTFSNDMKEFERIWKNLKDPKYPKVLPQVGQFYFEKHPVFASKKWRLY